jgi:hypothetical protein
VSCLPEWRRTHLLLHGTHHLSERQKSMRPIKKFEKLKKKTIDSAIIKLLSNNNN